MFDCFALGSILLYFALAFRQLLELQCFYCSKQHTNQAHKSSWPRVGRSRSFSSRSRSRRLSRRLSTADRSAGSPLFLVVFTVRHGIALVERTSAFDRNNSPEFGPLRLVRLLHYFGSFGCGETVAFVERFHLASNVLVEFLVRDVLVAIKGLEVEVINPPLGAGVTAIRVSK
jgi:hypothetical protein